MSALTTKPFQIYLREEQIAALRALAQKRGQSVAELIRQGIDLLLLNLPIEEDPLLDIIGMFDSGAGDLSTEHDHHLAKFEMADNHQ